jgi:hypothetical protein
MKNKLLTFFLGDIMRNYRTSVIGVIIIASALYQIWTSGGENTDLLKHFTSPEFLNLLVGSGLVLTKDAHNKNDDDTQ